MIAGLLSLVILLAEYMQPVSPVEIFVYTDSELAMTIQLSKEDAHYQGILQKDQEREFSLQRLLPRTAEFIFRMGDETAFVDFTDIYVQSFTDTAISLENIRMSDQISQLEDMFSFFQDSPDQSTLGNNLEKEDALEENEVFAYLRFRPGFAIASVPDHRYLLVAGIAHD